MTLSYQEMKSPIGTLVLAGNETHLYVVVSRKYWSTVRHRFDAVRKKTTPILRSAKKQLAEYFRGKRVSFDLPIQLMGTPFQNRAWAALQSIPYGQTHTYGQQAMAIHHPKAVRAVGRTNGQNPLWIVLPCHRIIGADGSLTGYAGGLSAKKKLLALEKASS